MRQLFSLFSFFDTFWTILYIIGAEGSRVVYNRCREGPDLCIIVAGKGFEGFGSWD